MPTIAEKPAKPRSDNSSFCKYMCNKYTYICRYTYNNEIAHKTRYLHDRYKDHYVCFCCHYTTKKVGTLVNQNNQYCPLCTNELTNIGLKFQAPKKTDVKGWKRAEELYKSNNFVFTYSSLMEPYDDLLPY